MDDRGHAVLRDGLGHQLAVAGVAGDEGNRARDQESETGRQVVEHDDRFTRVDEFVHHMAADIAGAASDQDRHDRPRLAFGAFYGATRKRVVRAPRERSWLWWSGLMNGYGGRSVRPV